MPGSTVTTLPGGQRRLRRRAQPRRLVDVDPDAVPEPVAEVLGVPGGADHVARDRVDVAALRPGRTAASAVSCASSTVP